MISNVLLFVRSLGELVRPEVLAEVNSGKMPMPNLGQIASNQDKMVSLKGKFACDHGANLSNLKWRATGEVATPDGLSNMERHRKAMLRWFSSERESPEQALNERMQQVELRRLRSLPSLPSLPSSEDSFLAWTSEDEYLFDRPVQQQWKKYDDSLNQVATVIEYINEGASAFDAQPAQMVENATAADCDLDEMLAKIDVGTAYHASSSLLMPNYWRD